MVDAEFLDLHAAEEVNIGCTAFDLLQLKNDAGLGHGFVVRIEQA